MSVADDVAAEIDRQVDFLHRCRSVFPRLHNEMAGQTEFEAPEYYRQLGYNVSVKLSQPMTAEFIDGLFELGHWLNENFVTLTSSVAKTRGRAQPLLGLPLRHQAPPAPVAA
jgi:hypothetical protein